MNAAVALLVSGASGMALPRKLLSWLARHPEVARLHLVVSKGAAQVLAHELEGFPAGGAGLIQAAGLSEEAASRVSVHRDSELDAPISSGSYRLRGTVILPASASTVGALATGSGSTLIHRAGAVALKERWPLVLGVRETPLSPLVLENLTALAWAGAVILPPIPAFYVGGESLETFLEAYAQRVLDHLGLGPPGPGHRWGS